MGTPSKRIAWIDCLKLFAIFLVVWGHSMHHLGWKQEQFYTGVDGWIYSFHMPLFMILSGFFSHKLLEGKFEWKKRFINLIVPCITFGLFCLAVGINSLNFWFLKSLFICYVIVGLYCLINVNKILKISILIIGCILFFPLLAHIPLLGAYKVDFMLPCFVFGIMLRKHFFWIEQHIKIISMISLCIFIICSIFWTKNCVWYETKPNWIDCKELIINHQLIFHPISLWHNVYRYITGFAGSMTFICLFCGLSKIQLCNSFMSKICVWGKYTLAVYLLQSFLVERNWLNVTVPTENNMTYCFIYTPLFALIIVVACLVMAYWFMKNKYVAFALFGRPLNIHKEK